MERSTARWTKTLPASEPTSSSAPSVSRTNCRSKASRASRDHKVVVAVKKGAWLRGRALFYFTLFSRRVRKRQFRVTRFLDFDDQGNAAFRGTEWKRLGGVFVRDGIHRLQVWIGTSFQDAAADLDFLVGIDEIYNRQRHSRVAARIFGLERVFSGADYEMIAFSANPDGYRLRRTVGHESGEVGEVRAVDELFHLGG